MYIWCMDYEKLYKEMEYEQERIYQEKFLFNTLKFIKKVDERRKKERLKRLIPPRN